jgi:hypothetical protein
LSHTSSPFYSGYFGDEDLAAQAGLKTVIFLILASQVARIMDRSNQHPAQMIFYQSLCARSWVGASGSRLDEMIPVPVSESKSQ